MPEISRVVDWNRALRQKGLSKITEKAKIAGKQCVSWAFLFLIFIGNSLAHQSVSRAYENLIKTFGKQRVESLMIITFAAAGLALVSAAFFRLVKTRNVSVIMSIASGWVYAFALFVFCGQVLICAKVEYVHFFQYGLLAFLCLRLSPSLHHVLWGITLLGILDETYNYIFYPFFTTYLDFNDFLLNFAGLVMGVMLYCSLFPRDLSYKPDFSIRMYGVAFFVISMLYLGLAMGWIVFNMETQSKPTTAFINGAFVLAFNSPPHFWVDLKGGGRFHVINPVEGSILLMLVLSIADQIFSRISRSCDALRTA